MASNAYPEPDRLELLLSLLNDRSQPNLNALTLLTKNISTTNLNIKTFGYDLARRLAEALPVGRATVEQHVGLPSKASVQADIESAWAAHWYGQLQIPIVFHRKLWELAYVLQAIFEHGHLRDGVRGLGFGCGEEPLPSYLASRGVQVTVTDLPTEEAQKRGWFDTHQYAATLDQAYKPHLVDRDRFDRLVDLQYVDMNAIPSNLQDYDFCWSVCALEHLGTIAKGLEFIENSLDTLRPGGLAVHTTEFNINPEGPTVDNWPTVLFQRKHLEELAEALRSKGHRVAPLDFHFGDRPMDRFVDLPPWAHDLPPAISEWMGEQFHLKVGLDGFISTCYGMIVIKGGA